MASEHSALEHATADAVLGGSESSERPWGTYRVLEEGRSHKVKRIVVHPGKRLKYQVHARRAEHWLMVRGWGVVTLDGHTIEIDPGSTIDVDIGVAHRVENPATENLVLIEVQHGDYFGEDDITRLEDDFGRASSRPETVDGRTQ